MQLVERFQADVHLQVRAAADLGSSLLAILLDRDPLDHACYCRKLLLYAVHLTGKGTLHRFCCCWLSLAWLHLGMPVLPPQHCFEPSDGGSQYRRVVAARLASRDDIVVHASEYAGRRLRDAARLLLDCARDVRLGASPTGPEVMLPIDLAFQCCLSVIKCRLLPS